MLMALARRNGYAARLPQLGVWRVKMALPPRCALPQPETFGAQNLFFSRSKSSTSIGWEVVGMPGKVGGNAQGENAQPRKRGYTKEMEDFTSRFLAAVSNVYTCTDPAQSSKLLRSLIQSKQLLYTDMRDAPEKFFLAHRLLSTIGLGGFGIRFTVQFNLFAGSILGLGGPEQLSLLDKLQTQGKLGCFLLTEMQAGVLSGLIVETTADFDPATQEFVLNTPSDKAAKNWISQGFVAEMGVVIADLRISGKSYGPHPFLMQMRDDKGELLAGIRLQDMGIKTVANDLDNARVWFDQVRLPKASLLNKYCDIVADKYVQVGGERMRIEVIGQRLLTGRMAIAQAAIYYAVSLHMKTEAYAKSKICNGIAGETLLYAMPHVRAVFDESYDKLSGMMAYTSGVEELLNECLYNGKIPDADLVEKIAVCKIRCIQVAIERVHALKLEVGSYALMHDTGFELTNMLLTCKFAEGDSRILQQKLARDRLRKVQKAGVLKAFKSVFQSGSVSEALEGLLSLFVAARLAPAGRDPQKMARALDANWRALYALADMIADRHISTGPKSVFFEPCEDRIKGADTRFDAAWKDKIEREKELLGETRFE